MGDRGCSGHVGQEGTENWKIQANLQYTVPSHRTTRTRFRVPTSTRTILHELCEVQQMPKIWAPQKILQKQNKCLPPMCG